MPVEASVSCDHLLGSPPSIYMIYRDNKLWYQLHFMTILTSELSKDVISIQKHLRHMLSRTIRKEYTLTHSLTHEGLRVQTTCLARHYFTNARKCFFPARVNIKYNVLRGSSRGSQLAHNLITWCAQSTAS